MPGLLLENRYTEAVNREETITGREGPIFFSISFSIYFFLREREKERERERETEREQGRGTERGRQNPKQAPRSKLSAQSPSRGWNPRTVRS